MADFQPKAHAVGVGIARLSTEKKLRPVGNTSSLPLVGAPEGAGSIKRPFNVSIKPFFSFVPQLATIGFMTFCIISNTIFVLGQFPGLSPSSNLMASSSIRSTASPFVRHTS